MRKMKLLTLLVLVLTQGCMTRLTFSDGQGKEYTYITFQNIVDTSVELTKTEKGMTFSLTKKSEPKDYSSLFEALKELTP